MAAAAAPLQVNAENNANAYKAFQAVVHNQALQYNEQLKQQQLQIDALTQQLATAANANQNPPPTPQAAEAAAAAAAEKKRKEDDKAMKSARRDHIAGVLWPVAADFEHFLAETGLDARNRQARPTPNQQVSTIQTRPEFISAWAAYEAANHSGLLMV